MAIKYVPRDAQVSRKRSSLAVNLIETVNYLDTIVEESGSAAVSQGSPISAESSVGSEPHTPSLRSSPAQSSQVRSSTVDLSQEEWDGGMNPALKAKLLSPITASKKVFRKFARNSSSTLANDSPSSPSLSSSPLSQSSPATISDSFMSSEDSSPVEPHPPMHTRPATPRPFRTSLSVSPAKPSPVTASSSVYSQDDAASVRTWQTESSSHTRRAVGGDGVNDLENTEVKDFGAANSSDDRTPPSSVQADSIFSFSPKRSSTGNTAANCHHIRNKSALPPPLTIRKVSTPTTTSFSIPPLPAAPYASTASVGLGLVHPALRDGAYTPTRDTSGGAQRDYLQVPPNSPVSNPGSPPTGGVWDTIVDKIVNVDATVDQNNSSTPTQRLLALCPGQITSSNCVRPSSETTAHKQERTSSQTNLADDEKPVQEQTAVRNHEGPAPDVGRPSCIAANHFNSPGSDESDCPSDDVDADAGARIDSPSTSEGQPAARSARNTIQGLPGPHRPTIVTPALTHTHHAAEVIVPASNGSLCGGAPSSLQRSQTAQPSSYPIDAPAETSQSLIARRIREKSEAIRSHSLASYSSSETIRASISNTTRSSQETLRAVPPPATPQKLMYDASSGSLGVESRSTPGRLSSITATHPVFCMDLFESPTSASAGVEQVALDRKTLEAQLRDTSPTRIPSRISLKKGEQVTPDLPSEPFRGLPSRFSDSSIEEGEEKRGFRQRVGLGGKIAAGGKVLTKAGVNGQGSGAGKVGSEGGAKASIKGGLVAEMRKRYA